METLLETLVTFNNALVTYLQHLRPAELANVDVRTYHRFAPKGHGLQEGRAAAVAQREAGRARHPRSEVEAPSLTLLTAPAARRAAAGPLAFALTRGSS
jgi:hypothetical protein